MKDQSNNEDPQLNEVKKLIEEALINSVDGRRKYRKGNALKQTVQALVSEYLDSFIIIGYDFDGRAVNIEGCTSDQQVDALETLLAKYFAYRLTGGHE